MVSPTLTISSLVDQALQTGKLLPATELEIYTVCNTAAELSLQDYMALDRLRQALQSGAVQALPRGPFVNIMEEMLLEETLRQLGQQPTANLDTLDLSEIMTHALNRLPPLYATTQAGAHHQRAHIDETLRAQIIEAVTEALTHCQAPLAHNIPIEPNRRQDLIFGDNSPQPDPLKPNPLQPSPSQPSPSQPNPTQPPLFRT
ncbi:MAG: late competence development ComFB family protein [Cyanobacteria bacterium J06632_22]